MTKTSQQNISVCSPPIKLVFSLIAATLVALPALASDMLPVELFSQRTQLWGPEVSPDGTHLVMFERRDGDEVMSVFKRDGDKLKPVSSSKSGEDIEYNWVSWASNTRLLVSVTTHGKIRRAGKTKWPFRRLMSMNIDQSESKLLLEDERFTWFRFVNDDIIHMLPDDPEHVLVGWNKDGDRESSAYKLNIYTGEKTLVQEAERGQRIFNWYADWDGIVRYGYGRDKKGRRILLVKRADGEWHPLHKNEFFEDGRFLPLGISYDKDKIYVLSSHITGRRSVFQFDMETGELAGKVFEHDTVDLNDLLISSKRQAVVAVSYTVDRKRLHYLDSDYAIFRGRIDNALPDGRVNTVVSQTHDEAYAVVLSSDVNHPGEYYWYDAAAPRLMLLGTRYQGIDPEAMAPMTRVTYEARDSLEIPAYLTVPQESTDTLPPGVVLPHGGPWTRDYLSFDMWSQFLASRGYVVLQPNFRGSSGYGNRYEALGHGGWGRAMQDDVTDGAQWMIDEGLVDPERICVVGGSYGGYAALMGIVKAPDIFKCAAAIAPVTDVKRMLKEDGDYKTNDYNYRRVAGNLTKKELDRISPIRRIDEMNAPILLMHGELDRNVSVKHSRDLAKKLKRADKEHTFIEVPEEGHTFREEENKRLWLTELEAFLNQHIGHQDVAAEGVIGEDTDEVSLLTPTNQ